MPSVRPSRLSAQQRQDTIVEAAAELFAARGFTGTTTKAIAARAGVSEALIFKYFRTKSALYSTIVMQRSPIPTLLREVNECAKRSDDAGVFLHIANTIVCSGPDHQLLRMILFGTLEDQEGSSMFFQQHVRVFYDFLAGYIRRRMRDGVFRSRDPLLAARSFMGMLIYHRLLTHVAGLPVKNSDAEIARTFVSMFLDGLRADDHVSRRRARRAGSRSSMRRVSRR